MALAPARCRPPARHTPARTAARGRRSWSPWTTAADNRSGTLARYARGRDYHAVMKDRLYALLRWLEYRSRHTQSPGRPYVDTGPILERDLARLAGLGWFGKNTMLIHPQRGLVPVSWRAVRGPRARSRCSIRRGALRNLSSVHRCLSHVRDRGRGRSRCHALHFVPDHREARRHPGRNGASRSGRWSTAATSARTSARGTCDSRARLGILTSPREASRHHPIRSALLQMDVSGLPTPIRRNRGHARRTPGAVAERRRGAREPRRAGRRPGAGGVPDAGARPGRAGARRVGSGRHRDAGSVGGPAVRGCLTNGTKGCFGSWRPRFQPVQRALARRSGTGDGAAVRRGAPTSPPSRLASGVAVVWPVPDL